MIADASVLILFSRARRLSILREIFGELEIPEEVRHEAIGAVPDRADAMRLSEALEEGWITVHAVPSAALEQASEKHPNLGTGERAVLALATTREEQTVLFDDRSARQAARIQGLRPVGSLGVLDRAYREGVLEGKAALAKAVRDVLDAGLWITANVIEAFWAQLGGRPEEPGSKPQR